MELRSITNRKQSVVDRLKTNHWAMWFSIIGFIIGVFLFGLFIKRIL